METLAISSQRLAATSFLAVELQTPVELTASRNRRLRGQSYGRRCGWTSILTIHFAPGRQCEHTVQDSFLVAQTGGCVQPGREGSPDPQSRYPLPRATSRQINLWQGQVPPGGLECSTYGNRDAASSGRERVHPLGSFPESTYSARSLKPPRRLHEISRRDGMTSRATISRLPCLESALCSARSSTTGSHPHARLTVSGLLQYIPPGSPYRFVPRRQTTPMPYMTPIHGIAKDRQLPAPGSLDGSCASSGQEV